MEGQLDKKSSITGSSTATKPYISIFSPGDRVKIEFEQRDFKDHNFSNMLYCPLSFASRRKFQQFSNVAVSKKSITFAGRRMEIEGGFRRGRYLRTKIKSYLNSIAPSMFEKPYVMVKFLN